MMYSAMTHWITYRDFRIWIEIITSWTGVEKVERKAFVADRGDHKIFIPIQWRWFQELVEIAKKKIDKHMRESY